VSSGGDRQKRTPPCSERDGSIPAVRVAWQQSDWIAVPQWSSVFNGRMTGPAEIISRQKARWDILACQVLVCSIAIAEWEREIHPGLDIAKEFYPEKKHCRSGNGHREWPRGCSRMSARGQEWQKRPPTAAVSRYIGYRHLQRSRVSA